MLKIENVVTPSPEQWRSVIMGARNPMNSWDRSDSDFTLLSIDDDPAIGPNDHDLMMRLRNAGTDHRKFMRMLTVIVTITAPLYWWKEFDTYKIATVSNSCSTMHKIADKEFTLEDFSHEHLMSYDNSNYWEEDDDNACFVEKRQGNFRAVVVPQSILEDFLIPMLNTARKKYIETKDKKFWWQMIQLLPSSYNQKRTIMLNYEVLNNIYHSRKGHKLDEWNEFCAWIESLPLSEVITGTKIEEKEDSPWISCTDENAKMPEEGDEILCTLKEDWSYGKGTDIQYHVFEGEYKLTKEDCYDMPAANGKGYFGACNDWDEGQPLSVIAWMPKPDAYKE